MTTPTDQPDWNLLPARPRDFFALPKEFGRKELKRAYNRLIRQFKPEKHPAEFQRIRAAFEQLDLELRYGQTASPQIERASAYQWDAGAAPGDDTTLDSTAKTAPSQRLALHERLQTEAPKQLYRELAERSQKTPYDFFSLALMSDVVDRKNPLQFAQWLLQGLKKFPGDHGLLHLMRDYLRDIESPSILSKMLIACSKAVPNDNFYPLTEPGWEVLLRNLPFAECLEALQKCQANLRDIGIAGQVVFTIRMLRFALWQDHTDWKQESLDFVEENFEQIPAHLELEVDILTAVHQYVATRQDFLKDNPLRQQIDRAMEGYFTLDQVEGDQLVVQCQLAILDDNEQLQAAFPIDLDDDSNDCEAMYTLWNWLSADVGDRYGVEEQEEVNTELWLGRTNALLKQCRAHTKQSVGDTWYDLYVYGTLLCLILGCIFIPGFIGLALVMTYDTFIPGGDSGVSLVILGVAIAAGLFLVWRISKYVSRRFGDPFYKRVTDRNYHRLWRREVMDFLDRSQLNFYLTTQLITHAADHPVDQLVSEYVQKDYGLAMFTTARQFLI